MINEGWALLCLIGLWGWILATVVFIFKAFSGNGVFQGRSALPYGGAIVVFYVVWLMGMFNA